MTNHVVTLKNLCPQETCATCFHISLTKHGPELSLSSMGREREALHMKGADLLGATVIQSLVALSFPMCNVRELDVPDSI